MTNFGEIHDSPGKICMRSSIRVGGVLRSRHDLTGSVGVVLVDPFTRLVLKMIKTITKV